MLPRLLIRSIVVLVCLSGLPRSVPAAEFFIRDGDRVVLLGDSITEQGKPGETDRGGLYTVYIEAYALTRFPTWNLVFRNVGIGGDTATMIQRQVAGFDRQALKTADEVSQQRIIAEMIATGLNRDVLPWKPTLVTIDFGMNDFGYQAFNEANFRRYLWAQQELIQRLQASGSRIALITPQPIEQPPAVSDSNEGIKNAALRRFAGGLEQLAGQRQIPLVNQFDPYQALVEQARTDSPRAYLGGGSDAVHPGPPGHAIMAWIILKRLGATPLVSAAEIDAATKRVIAAERCQIMDLAQSADGTLSFTRTDEALPLPLDARAESALKRAPIIDDLNLYVLKITGLESARYDVLIDDELAATVEASDLARGWNMATAKGPITAQAQLVLQLILKKNAVFFRRWKEIGLDPTRQAEAPRWDERVAAAEAELNAARRPKPHQFKLTPRSQ
jgi:lysophospholipase L1-like esterase